MEPVSTQFLESLSRSHKRVTEATFTLPEGETVTLDVLAGKVKGDSQSNYRRTGNASFLGGRDVYELLSTPGGILHVDHGLQFGSTAEMVPVFHGEIAEGSQTLGTGAVDCSFADLGRWVERTDFLRPYNPANGTPRTTVIANVIVDTLPAATVINTSSDTDAVGNTVWPDKRHDVINDLTRDGGTEAFWAPDGTFTIRDQPTLNSPSVWMIKSGESGVLKSAQRRRPLDRMYNTVVVRPSTADGSQPWKQQVAQITDPNHPRHPDKVGVVPYFWNSPTARTEASALRAARKLLARVDGVTETLSLSALSNPALDVGDVIRVGMPPTGSESAEVVQHFIDSFDLDWVTGEMTAATRSQGLNA